LEQRVLLSAGDSLGTAFTDFGPHNTESGGQVVRLADQKILQVGTTSAGGTTSFALAQFNADGSIDNDFATVTKSLPGSFTDANGPFYSITSVNAVAVNPTTHRIVVVGTANNETNGDLDWLIAVFDEDGNLDTSFGTGGVVISDFTPEGVTPLQVNEARAVVIQSDGKIVVAGSDTFGAFEGFAVARYTTSGVLDGSFGNNGLAESSIIPETMPGNNSLDRLHGVAIDDSGRIVLVGSSQDVLGGETAPVIALQRYINDGVHDGTLDTDFGSSGSVRTNVPAQDQTLLGDTAYTVAVDADGKILVGGITDGLINETSFEEDFVLLRYHGETVDGIHAGDLDLSFGSGSGIVTTSFGNGSDALLSDVAIQSNGKIVIGGGVVVCADENCNSTVMSFVVGRYNTSGTVDTTFGTANPFPGFAQSQSFDGQPDQNVVSIAIQDNTDTNDQTLAFGSWMPNGSSQDFILARFDLNVAAVSSGDTSVTIDGDESVNEGDTVNVNGTVTSGGGGSGTAWLQYEHQAAESAGGGGGPITSVTIDWGDGSAPQNVPVTAGAYSANHQYIDDNPSVTSSDIYTVTVTAGTASADYEVTVSNVAPMATINGAPASGPEGTAIALTSTVSDLGTADTFTYAWSVTKNGNPYATGSAANFTFTPNDNGIYVVSLAVTDDDLGVGSAVQQTINVTNVAPTVAAISGPASGVRLFTQNFSSSFTDPGSADTWTVTWNFGDGNTQTSSGSPGALSASHVYAANGAYTVTLTVTDDDTGSDSKTKGITIVSAAVIGGTLQVGGLGGADNVALKASGSGVNLNLNGASSNFSGFSQIFIISGNGADTINVNNNVTQPLVVFAGAGNDSVKGGGNDDILMGGDGADLLQGQDGRDLLIGGDGADRIIGMADDDILVAGYSSYDNDAVALNAILSEWTSGRSYGQRSANILNQNVTIGTTTFTPSATRNNGSFFLKTNAPNATVSDDADVDVLTGSPGRDLFLFNVDGGVKDKVTDLAGNEFAADIDFINSVPT